MKSIHDPRYLQLINLLIFLRESKQLTQVELAKRLARPQSFVAKVENLDRRVDLVELADWISALDVSRQDFTNRLNWW